MKRLFLISLLFLILILGCSSGPSIKHSYQTYGEIENQLNSPDLQPQPGDSKEVLQQKAKLKKVLQDAQKEIIKKDEENTKLEKEKDKLLPDAGVGSFMNKVLGVLALGIVAYIIAKVKGLL